MGKKNKLIIYQNSNSPWIVLIDEIGSEKKLGITNLGEWIVQATEKTFILDNEKSFLHAISMLNMPYELIKSKINERYQDTIKDFEPENIFPFYEIVNFVFKYVVSDYWFDLAFKWFEKFDYSQKKD